MQYKYDHRIIETHICQLALAAPPSNKTLLEVSQNTRSGFELDSISGNLFVCVWTRNLLCVPSEAGSTMSQTHKTSGHCLQCLNLKTSLHLQKWQQCLLAAAHCIKHHKTLLTLYSCPGVPSELDKSAGQRKVLFGNTLTSQRLFTLLFVLKMQTRFSNITST